MTDFNLEPIPHEWLALTLFGEQCVSEGGGASSLIGVHNLTEEVLGLDPESEDNPLFLISSSLRQFVHAFLLFDSVLRTGEVEPQVLAERARAIDPEGYPRSEWKLLAEFVLEA